MTMIELESLVKIVGGIIAAGAAIIATFKALAEWRRATQQRRDELSLREREFRQKQATFARQLIKEVFADTKARTALKMLDWLDEEYVDDDGSKYRIKREEIQSAMRAYSADCPSFSDKEAFIRTSFESLYDQLEQMEHLIDLGVIAFDDVETAFRYFMIRVARPGIQHFDFLVYYDYPRATKFIKRFQERKT